MDLFESNRADESFKLIGRREYRILPVPKPRMTQRDKWKSRPCVLRYRHFKDQVRALNIKLPYRYKVTFHIPMPKSWSNKKRVQMNGAPHMQKPDKDNLEKALLDSIYGDDSHVWSGWAEKRWAEMPSIVIEEVI